MNVTGDATRTISSTAVGRDALEVVLPDRPLVGVLARAGASRWLMAVRVVSLPATASRMKNGAISLRGEHVLAERRCGPAPR